LRKSPLRIIKVGVNGILNLNKPIGITSFGAVARIRRFTGEKRTGHAGTLDPFATGVLPICLGSATRLTEYLHEFTKEYQAVIELGTTTDTYDCDGTVTSRAIADEVSLQVIQDTLRQFVGCIDQVPPVYSAIKLKGRQSYDLAREGINFTHQPRPVRIDSINIIRFSQPFLEITVRCSKGTYIRSLANDIGTKLGCGAYLKELVRRSYGPFVLEHSLSIEVIESACMAGSLSDLLYQVDYPLQEWDKMEVDANTALRIIHGEDIVTSNVPLEVNRLIRAYDPAGKFLALLKFGPDTGLWHPVKVFTS
jgi:tRNA pseudouridine55 synthase